MKNPIWTLEEIEKLSMFGGNVGWFYGLVKHHETGRVWVYEIFPGTGYARTGWIYHPKPLWWVIKDIWRATKRVS
ncbi:MAG TPA: hypothetical protein VI432_00105 [Candidatus Paceibacterota bacterium]